MRKVTFFFILFLFLLNISFAEYYNEYVNDIIFTPVENASLLSYKFELTGYLVNNNPYSVFVSFPEVND